MSSRLAASFALVKSVPNEEDLQKSVAPPLSQASLEDQATELSRQLNQVFRRIRRLWVEIDDLYYEQGGVGSRV